ncbi:type VII secretion-associated serine protease mycosin [Streptomyces aureoverticillatus]|uniref:type VII secretion-associated serine protease mycosin n=1 Tax=Streptomyces aureoverticillatus TaxID=66871 RepID=UPI0013D9618E|nr:type VII secretion-associated serine protease mycosin [Streptomyces aureoverticillatus]QIB43836.1 type VII secretion-associated serine protease mycosin [Streptomyces aureoverticillatus]
MRASTMWSDRSRTMISGTVGLLLVGVAATPAHADSIREKQWHLNAMKAEQMWQTSTGKGVTVAVIDTGVDDSLPDLRGRVLPGRDLAPRSAGDEHTDYEGHGTTMALLIAGTGRGGGGTGTLGLAPDSKILPIRTSDHGLDANRYTREANEEFSHGIRYAADSGAQVINISMGVFKGSKQLTAAVKYAHDKGSLVLAATGNKGTSSLNYPAGTPGVVGVGAIGKNLHKTKESQYGPQVDIAAPGDETYTACPNGNGTCEGHGTSDATALASASAALIWSKHPDWTNNQVLRVMLNTIGGPTDGAKRNDSIGYGIVRPRVALQNPGDPGPADVYPLPDLKQAASTSPAPSPSESEAARPDDEKTSAAAPAVTEGSDGGTSTTTWIVTGVGAAALIGGAAAVMAVRKRRSAAYARVTGRP